MPVRMFAGDANDNPVGEAGIDMLECGSRAFQFVFVSLALSEVEQVMDSTSREDLPVLSSADVDRPVDGLQGFTFLGTAPFGTGMAGTLHSQAVDANPCLLLINTDNDAAAEASIRVFGTDEIVLGDLLL